MNQPNRENPEPAEESRQEDSVEEEIQEATPELEPLTYFGTDFDVEGLVRRLNNGDIIIARSGSIGEPLRSDEGFQRAFVWKKGQMDKFIESLLLGFPIPGIFLVQQPDHSYLVLDGQQRLMTLDFFYSDQFMLENVANEFRGLSYQTLSEVQRRALDTTFIHATIVKFNPAQSESVFTLFERLNTGGTALEPQEIRAGLYGGPFEDLLRHLNEFPDWREMYGPRSLRQRDQEIILRFLAFYESSSRYRRPLKAFLNEFMDEHRDLQGLDEGRLELLFQETCTTANRALGPAALRPTAKINSAFADAVLVGLARRLETGPITDISGVTQAREALLQNDQFINAISSATASEERVHKRLEIASEAFRAVL